MQGLKGANDNSFHVVEKLQIDEHVLIPIKIIFNSEDDVIFAPYRVVENDGRTYPFYDNEDLQEIDTEAFCVRVSRVKKEVENTLNEIIDFLIEYEWEDEIYFERKDEKVKT